MVNLEACIAQFTQQAQLIQQFVLTVSDDQARWKPNNDSWSILEVVNHLYDEERDDFRTRLKHILDQVEGLPPAIHPGQWVTERRYNERELPDSIAQFMQERGVSLEWLRTLKGANWDLVLETPFGRFTSGDMLMSWLAHDLLHLRQLVELHYAYHKQRAQPYDIEYAGDW